LYCALSDPHLTVFPYTTLFRSSDEMVDKTQGAVDRGLLAAARRESMTINMQWTDAMLEKREAIIAENVSLIRSIPEKYFTEVEGDRKSTRLNSSHVSISYAVFC